MQDYEIKQIEAILGYELYPCQREIMRSFPATKFEVIKTMPVAPVKMEFEPVWIRNHIGDVNKMGEE